MNAHTTSMTSTLSFGPAAFDYACDGDEFDGLIGFATDAGPQDGRIGAMSDEEEARWAELDRAGLVY